MNCMINAGRAVCLAVFSLLAGAERGGAQDLDLAKAYDAGVTALQSGNYDKGLAIVAKVIDAEEEQALRRYGPSFGHFYYLKGRLFIGQTNYEKAIEALRTCYEEWGNEKRKGSQVPNLFHAEALVQWGLCLQALEKHREAIGRFQAALALSAREAQGIDRGVVKLNLANCYLREGRKEEGQALLEEMLSTDELSDEALQNAFTLLAAGGGQDVMKLVRQHAVSLLGSEESRRVMNPRFAGLASQVLQDGDPKQALVFYSLIRPPGEERDRLLSAGDRAKEALEELEKAHRGNLLGMAFAHDQSGNWLAALSLYAQLEAHYPGLGERAQVLHNLVVCASRVQQWSLAETQGRKFLLEFPSHDLRAGVYRVLADALYEKGNPKEAANMMEEAAKAGGDRESLDFIRAVSLFERGEGEAAKAAFEDYRTKYPKGANAEAALYLLATIYVQGGNWNGALPVFKQYIEDYPEGTSRPSALHLSALGHLLRQQPEYALVQVNELLKDHRNAPEVARALQVKGDALLMMGRDYAVIQTAYQQARNEALKQGGAFREVAAYSLRQLISIAVSAEKWEDAVGAFDSFQRSYMTSKWRFDAVSGAASAQAALGERQKGVELLKAQIVKESEEGSQKELEQAVQRFTQFLQSQMDADEAEELAAGLVIELGKPAVQATVLGSLIEGEQNEDQKESLLAQLDGLGKEHRDDLGPWSLLLLAQWKQESFPSEARSLYREVSGTTQGLLRAKALVGLAEMEAGEGSKPKRDSARERFADAVKLTEDSEVWERSILGMARLAQAEEKWEDGAKYWLTYLDQGSWNRSRPEANFGYATCLDGMGEEEEALKVYISVYANFPEQLDLSTASYLRSAEILWNSGRQLDALKVLQDLLRRFDGKEEMKHPGYRKAEETFFQWRTQFSP